MDILQREGKYPLPPGAPTILGVEFSGHIAALGPNVSDTWNEGDQVFGIASGVSKYPYQPPSPRLTPLNFTGSVRRIHPRTRISSHPQTLTPLLDRSRQHPRGISNRYPSCPTSNPENSSSLYQPSKESRSTARSNPARASSYTQPPPA